MRFPPSAIGLLLVLASGSFTIGHGQSVGTRAEFGLSGTLADFRDLDQFGASLATYLNWRASAPESVSVLRLTALRIARGRVMRSSRSRPLDVPSRPERVAAAYSRGEWLSLLRECCLGDDDPPMRATAVSGTEYLSPLELETAVAELAEREEIGVEFGLARPVELDWARHVVIVFAASADPQTRPPPVSPALVRPLLLVLDRR